MLAPGSDRIPVELLQILTQYAICRLPAQVHVIQSAKGLSCVKVEWELWGSELIVTQSPPSRLPPRVTTAGLPTVLGTQKKQP